MTTTPPEGFVPAATTNVLGARVLQLYAAGSATRTQLDTAYYIKRWINEVDYLLVTEPATEG